MSLPTICTTAALLAAPPPHAVDVWQEATPVPISAGLETRGVAEGIVGTAESEHFVFAWGADYVPDEAQQAVVIDALEAAWADQVDTLGFSPPPGSYRYKLNVYQAGSGITIGGVALDVPGAGGWNAIDPEGWPFIAFPADMWEVDALYAESGFNAPGDTIRGMLTHEFQHSCQFGAMTWSGSTAHIWFVESLAEWAALRAVPGDLGIEQGLLALIVLPHLALEWSDPGYYAGSHPDPLDVGDEVLPAGLEGVHFYTGWPLLDVVAEELGDEAVVAWAEERGTHDTPMASLQALLANTDSDPLAAWAEALGRVRTDDLGQVAWGAALFETSAASPQWTGEYGDVLLELEVDGTWQQHPDVDLLPQHLGFSRWRVEAPPDLLLLDFDGDAVGSEGTPVEWALVAMTLDEAGDGTSQLLPLSADVPLVVDLAGAAALELFVVPGAETYVEDEVFDYRIAGEPLVLAPEEPGGCSTVRSSTVRTSASLAVLLLLPLTLLGRRRR